MFLKTAQDAGGVCQLRSKVVWSKEVIFIDILMAAFAGC